jgi:PAS domain S-box-containing protein
VEHRGRPALLCSFRDATARLRAETALRASEERFRTVVERMAEGLIITDLESRIVYTNPRVEDIFGWRPEELLGKVSWEVLVAPEERAAMAARIPRRREGEQERYEVRARRRDGSTCWIEVAAAPFRNADGEVVGTLGAVTDVTERRRIREDLERSLSLLGATLDATTDGILSVDLEGRITGYNAPFLEMWRLDPPAPGTLEVPLLRNAASLVAQPESFVSDILAWYEHPESEVHDEIRFHDGRVLERALRPQRLGDQVVGRVWSFRDVTDRARARAALQAQRAYLRAVLDALPTPVWSKDWDGRFTLANQALGDIYGVTADALLGRTDADYNRSAEEVEQYLEGDRAVMRDGSRKLVVEEPITHADGQTRWYHTRKVGLVPPDGGRPQVLGIATDITERQRAQAALQESEAQFRAIFDASAIGTTMLDAGERVLRANTAFQRMVGLPDQALRGTPLGELVHPADRQAHGEMFRQLVAGEIAHYQREKRLVRADGGVIWVRLTGSLVQRTEGRDPFVIGMVEDVTERRHAEEALAESQRQLLHSQKMEAVGRLAGGIAHDFNNMLMAIGGHAELLRTEPEMPASCRWQADEIRKAADRAAGLTRQLLAFSRKQVMQPRPLSVNAVITDMEDMLRRLIGETIRLRTSLTPHVGVVRADPGQLEQVLMNLAVNARDAMPQGGTLAVQTDNVTLDAEYAALHDEVVPGRYVMLAVADTGTGMDADVRQRIFEPFFTTKPQGQGTGLGLSTVYGIVAQSGGHVRVESEPGKGTVFLIYLPREDRPHETPAVAAPQPALGGRETLLLVEDDEVVRELLRMFLLRLGYRVLGAGSGDEALAAVQAHGSPPDLLLTDVVMPGMSGRELARAVRERWPGVAVIYMSGYTDDAIEQHGVLDPGSEFIQKPVSPDLLAHRVRAVLDAPG